jgi:NADPH-dependent curcumin reductase CurA
MTAGLTGREVHLAARPDGVPKPGDFALVAVDVPAPADGQIVIRNTVMSVDPYMRGRMNDVKSYAPPFALGEVMTGGAVGVVVESKSPDVAVGDSVLHDGGWREYAVRDASHVQKVDVTRAPASSYLGVLGMTGLTAYAGLVGVAEMKKDDAVFISGAAGAVGSMAGQFAKLLGASRVIGSAGSAEKVAELTGSLGYDAAFDYKQGDIHGQLKKAAPDGIDVYFDNVGGEHLEAAISAFNLNGRAAICGMISQYNASAPTPGPRNLALLIGKRLTLKGFLVGDQGYLRPQFVQDVGGWLAAGKLNVPETFADGIEHAVDAFLGLFSGGNTGKMLVRLGE